MTARTVAEFIDSLGGNACVAKLLKLPHRTAVSNWRKWDAIPPKHRRGFVRLCEQQNIPVPEDLFRVVPAVKRLKVAG